LHRRLLKLWVGGIASEGDALVDLEDVLVENFWTLDVEGEDVGSGLV
jgi:hypothetical protein